MRETIVTHNRIRLILFIFLACLSLCAGSSIAASSELIKPGDKLKMEVFGQPDLSADIVVTPDNTATFPLLGIISTDGKTITQLRDEIRLKLDKDYLVDPKVNLDRVAEEPFYILGQVKNPGTYDFHSDMDVRKAVAIAGGYTSRAKEDEPVIVRKSVKIEASPDTILQPGDTVEIKLRWF